MVHAPGHTPGHVFLFRERDRVYVYEQEGDRGPVLDSCGEHGIKDVKQPAAVGQAGEVVGERLVLSFPVLGSELADRQRGAQDHQQHMDDGKRIHSGANGHADHLLPTARQHGVLHMLVRFPVNSHWV